MARDKTSLDIFWLKDKSLTDLDALPSPDILAAEIVDNLQAALHSFNEVAESLKKRKTNLQVIHRSSDDIAHKHQ